MPRDQARRRAGLGQPLRGLAVDGDPLVRRELLDQRLAHQLVAEAVAGAGDDQDPGVQRDVEQRERLRLGGAGQRHDAGGIEVVARQRQPPQHRHRVLVEVEEPRRDRVRGRRDERRDPRDGAAGQLEREERVALGELHDPLDDLGCPRRRRARRHERGRVLAVERPEVDLHGLAGPRQPRHAAGQRLGCRLRPVGEHGQRPASRRRSRGAAARRSSPRPRGARRRRRARPGRRRRRRAAAGEARRSPGGGSAGPPAARPARPGPSARPARRGRGRRAASSSAAVARRQLLDRRSRAGAYGPPASVAATVIDRQPSASATRPPRGRTPTCRCPPGPAPTSAPSRSSARPQQRRRPRQLELAADERGLARSPGRRRTRRRAPRSRRSAGSPARAAGRSAAARTSGSPRGGCPPPSSRAHQLPVRGLVGGLDLDQPLPLAAAPQQLQVLRPQALARRLGPLLVQGLREAGRRRRRPRPRRRPPRRRRPGPRPPRPRIARRRSPPAAHGNSATCPPRSTTASGLPQGLPGVVRGLAQVRGARPRRRDAATAPRSPGRARGGARRRAPGAARARRRGGPATRPPRPPSPPTTTRNRPSNSIRTPPSCASEAIASRPPRAHRTPGTFQERRSATLARTTRKGGTMKATTRADAPSRSKATASSCGCRSWAAA